MNFWWLRYFPTKYIWDPRLSFTGVTILGYNAETGVPSALSPDTLRGSCGAPDWPFLPCCVQMRSIRNSLE